jgi:hypothetical protein
MEPVVSVLFPHPSSYNPHTMKTKSLLLLPLLLFAVTTAFPQSTTDTQPAKSITVTGKLTRSMAIGGESTGWTIELDKELTVDSHPVKSLEVDAPAAKLEPLADKHISARGRLTTIESPERGKRTILKISRIRELAPPAKP